MRSVERRQILAGLACLIYSGGAAGQEARARHVGVLMASVEADPDGQARIKAFRIALRDFGWIEGQNLLLHVRWAAGGSERFLTYAAELVALDPDLLLADATPSVAALVRHTTRIPVVFCRVADPVGSGFVHSLARPGTNMTGFTAFDPAMGLKWLELLKEAAPDLKQVVLLFNPRTAPHVDNLFLPLIQAAGLSVGIGATPARVRSAPEIEEAIRRVAGPGVGLAAMPDTFLVDHRQTIIRAAAQHRMPAIYTNRIFTVEGGLMSYGFDVPDMYLRAAAYADRILRGAAVSELPVQTPRVFQLTVNLATGKVLGLELAGVLGLADEVLE